MTKTIGKTELVEQVSAKVGAVPKLYEIIGAVFDAVAENLAKGDAVTIRDFGTFKVVQRKERKGRNPKMQEEITIPAQKKVIFKQGKTVNEKVNVL